MVLSRSNQMGLHTHIRTTRVDNPHGSYSYISSAAVKVGSEVFEVTEDGAIYVNGVPTVLNQDTEFSFAGYTLTKTLKGRKNRIIIYHLRFDEKKSVQIRANTKSSMLFVDVDAVFEDSEGLLGAAPAEGSKSLLARDGVTDLSGNWNTYGEEWQVNDEDPELFMDTKHHPQYPDGCIYKGSKKKQNLLRRRLLSVVDVTQNTANHACAHLKNGEMRKFCIQDVLATGDVELAEDTFYATNSS